MKRGGPLKRTELKRKTPMASGAGLARKPIKKKPPTDKQKADRAEFAKGKRIIRERSGGQCEFHTGGMVDHIHYGLRCSQEATQAHHISRQGQGHDHRPVNLLDMCFQHHIIFIHTEHVKEAQEMGYLTAPKTGPM